MGTAACDGSPRGDRGHAADLRTPHRRRGGRGMASASDHAPSDSTARATGSPLPPKASRPAGSRSPGATPRPDREASPATRRRTPTVADECLVGSMASGSLHSDLDSSCGRLRLTDAQRAAAIRQASADRTGVATSIRARLLRPYVQGPPPRRSPSNPSPARPLSSRRRESGRPTATSCRLFTGARLGALGCRRSRRERRRHHVTSIYVHNASEIFGARRSSAYAVRNVFAAISPRKRGVT